MTGGINLSALAAILVGRGVLLLLINCLLLLPLFVGILCLVLVLYTVHFVAFLVLQSSRFRKGELYTIQICLCISSIIKAVHKHKVSKNNMKVYS